MTESTALPRDGLLARLRSSTQFDVAIIGGGATGLGCAVDAASRGLSTVLLEGRDFAAGTSSRSSKLIHGGLRYLAQGRLALVHEALSERARLLANAPHLVHPLRFVVPANGLFQRVKLSAGVMAYHALAGRHALGATEMLGNEAARRAVPNLAPAMAPSAVAYWDAQFDDARLAIDLMKTVFDHGGLAINRIEVLGAVQKNGRVAALMARDGETGESFEVAAKVVINAAGVWADRVRQSAAPGAPALLAVSRGIHLTVDKTFLGGSDALVVPETPDGRLLFVLPWLGKTIIGTTDTPCDAPDDDPRPSEEEIDFVLQTAAPYLRRAPRRSDVTAAFAGLRPLLNDLDHTASHDGGNTAALSREHQVREAPNGLISVVGGKWTTYRAMAEDAVDAAIASARLDARPCVTAQLPIHRSAPLAALDERSLATAVAETVRYEQAHRVDDVLARRHRLLFLDVASAIRLAPAVADALARESGRDLAWRDAELQRFVTLASRYQVEPSGPSLF